MCLELNLQLAQVAGCLELFLLQSFLILFAKMFGLLLQKYSLSSNRLQLSSLERLDSLSHSHSLYSHSDTCSFRSMHMQATGLEEDTNKHDTADCK